MNIYLRIWIGEKKMSEWILLFIGMSIGSILGFILTSLFTVSKMTDLNLEIQDLRVQRQLLREELDKPRGKPKPRRRRKKNV